MVLQYLHLYLYQKVMKHITYSNGTLKQKRKRCTLCISIVVIPKKRIHTSTGIAQDKYLIMKCNTIARASQMDDADPKHNQHVFDIYTLHSDKRNHEVDPSTGQ